MGLVVVAYKLKCDKCGKAFSLVDGDMWRLFQAARDAKWCLYVAYRSRSNLGTEVVDCLCPECAEND